MSFTTTKDGTQIYYNDWGSGQPVVFSHGWPLSADAFEDQMFYLASRGYRCIAHDRRGHGRSSQPWNGNDLDTYADDLAELVRAEGADPHHHVARPHPGLRRRAPGFHPADRQPVLEVDPEVALSERVRRRLARDRCPRLVRQPAEQDRKERKHGVLPGA